MMMLKTSKDRQRREQIASRLMTTPEKDLRTVLGEISGEPKPKGIGGFLDKLKVTTRKCR
jgi:hypothetical protein